MGGVCTDDELQTIGKGLERRAQADGWILHKVFKSLGKAVKAN